MKRTIAVCLLFWAGQARGAEIRRTAVAASEGQARAEWSARVERLLASGELAVRDAREDTLLPGRQHERLAQLYKGVPVFGGELAVQSDAAQVLTVFGTFYEGIDVDPTPSLRVQDIERIVEDRGGNLFGSRSGPELVILPTDAGLYALAYRVRFAAQEPFDIRVLFVDARDGHALLEYSDLQRQSVGLGTGVLGDQKKVSARSSGSGYVADDALRPPVISTFDFHGNVNRLVAFLNSSGTSNLRPADLATDADNVWTDGANVDAHVYAGYTYDYYFKRFGRRGLNNANISILSVTHPIQRDTVLQYTFDVIGTFFVNAFYAGDGMMVYGDGLPTNLTLGGQRWNYLAGALDVVGHELSHGVTDYSSRLIYQGESGALNESFSDMMGTSIEFYSPAARGTAPDYLIGEDVVTPGGIRSMQNPAAFGDPDHYSIRYTGSQDNGGVHTNSGISNNAFYLAIEGGTNRVSGIAVSGVGGTNREQIEKVFYRAFTSFLTPSANFAAARAATIQAARELYGVGSAAERAVTQAWTAVGVN